MITLHGEHIYLRAIEPSDLAFLYQLENDERFWAVSNTQKPFSKFLLQQYLDNAQQDIYEAKQLRLMVCEKLTDNSVGMIDLFNFEPKHRRVGTGILIDPKYWNKGFASEAIALISKFVFQNLDVHQIYANIGDSNVSSIKLFEKNGFIKSGTKKDWNFTNGKFENELLYQLINE
ncbi:GNAT family N-acetyltransferase [Urechidicola vernalis]|uniref:GNAT family protein n=1 Tax=Urechidicola vernalis TaxID=3075600 RepID=A0ABU2Y7W3_9FLAO|nr:GNAT family protein [Urechidicola sp. P050]MDT0554285.1 GNAT family protein [Urechidicola sp. P050]